MNDFYEIMQDINQNYQLNEIFKKVSRLLLEGKTIGYRDNIPLNIEREDFDGFPNYSKQFSDFMYENFEFMREFFFMMDYTLKKYQYPVSNLEKYRWSYVLDWSNEQINPQNKINLSRSKLLICGIVYLTTNMGLKFQLLEDLLSDIADRPSEVFLDDVDFENIFRIIHPNAPSYTKTSNTVETLKNKFSDELKSLVDIDYIILVKSKNLTYISVGPNIFHLQSLLSDILKRTENE